MTSSDNEKLIEEARKAVGIAQDSIWRTSPDPDGDARYEAVLDQMLAVFEKAHTPTDDEREALSEASRRLSEGLDPDLREGWTVLPDDLLDDFRAVMAATRRWKAEPFAPDWDMEAAARRVNAREDALLSEPQGEPSDAAVRAAQEVLAKWRPMPESVVRDALRAAGKVNPSVGDSPL